MYVPSSLLGLGSKLELNALSLWSKQCQYESY